MALCVYQLKGWEKVGMLLTWELYNVLRMCESEACLFCVLIS